MIVTGRVLIGIERRKREHGGRSISTVEEHISTAGGSISTAAELRWICEAPSRLDFDAASPQWSQRLLEQVIYFNLTGREAIKATTKLTPELRVVSNALHEVLSTDFANTTSQ